MVYESRVGDVFTLGSHELADRGHHPRPGARLARARPAGQAAVLARRRPGPPGRARPRARRVRPRAAATAGAAGQEPASWQTGLDDWAADNLLAFLAEQREATGHVPDDRTIVVERFRDELGDWRVAVHSPFGAQVHAPWALATERAAARALRRRRPGHAHRRRHRRCGCPRPTRSPPPELAVFDADEVEPLVTDEVGGSALFASRFRECAARALLLPRRNPGRRTPLWQQRQRQRAAAVGGVAVRLVPDRARDDARVPAGRLRRARPRPR